MGGQTLLMAMIVLGVLLVLGLVFIGIISGNIGNSARARQRSVATDLAEAGVRYAHSQLLHSTLLADWRGAPVSLNAAGGDFTRDPDVLFLRQGTGYGIRTDADPQVDLGGPDGLGPYTRVNFDNGRALVRVRYAPSDLNIFSTSPTGSLRNPAKARYYTIIESVGRPGKVDFNDPTTLLFANGIQFRNYGSGLAFRQAWGEMKNRDNRFAQSRKVIAFVSIGIIEDALFITNLNDVSSPAPLGVQEPLGVRYQGLPVSVPLQLGSQQQVYSVGNPPNLLANLVGGGGSLYSNADLELYGKVDLLMNQTLGDHMLVHGTMAGIDDNTSVLNVAAASWNGASWVTNLLSLTNVTAQSINSRSPNYSTLQGLLRDGMAATDAAGNARSVPRKEPPSMMRLDPDTGLNPYRVMTMNSGQLLGAGNSGQFGQGGGVYVGNTFDLQMRSDAEGRADVGSAESLVYDWLNPNNGQQGSGWKGPYYIPPGAFVQFNSDGFIITRDGSNRPANSPDNQRTWRRGNGVDSGLGTIRFRIGDVNGVPFIINTLTPGVNISVANPDFTKGLPFNGVLFFEGNVRVRGIIPTDRQITLVSNATIYVEGSITKGILDSNGNPLNRPSQSMLMLMAKDYVALNTSQFFGPGFQQSLEEVNETTSAAAWNPLRIHAGDGSLVLFSEFLDNPDNPATNPLNPGTWRSFIQDYRQFADPNGNTGTPIDTQILTSAAMDDGPAAYSFFTLDIDPGLPTSSYLFALSPSNAATPFFPLGYVTPGYTTPNYAPLYGLGSEAWQRYPKFESNAYRLLSSAAMTATPTSITTSGTEGTYTMVLQGTGQMLLHTTSMAAGATNDLLLARLAITPHDVRIEASVYAEQGSFFVIPGNWYNPDPNDTRDRYLTLGATDADRAQARLDTFGSFPWMPFYNEPLDVRVSIVGAVSENMPPTISQQAEWVRKWGWIPSDLAATGQKIPFSHVPAGFDIRNTGPDRYVPNLVITYDPTLATARAGGYNTLYPYVRADALGRALPPMPRLPVSPTVSYFGEVNP